MSSNFSEVIVVGGGIFGLSTAVELAKRKHKVALLNPDTLPHHLAASTDISKAVRVEYGSDEEYFKMAEECMDKWKEWNEILPEKIYHEIGFLMLSQKLFSENADSYESRSMELLKSNGYPLDILSSQDIAGRYPIVNHSHYSNAHFNPHGGFVESGKSISLIADYARSLGVKIHEHQTVINVNSEKSRVTGVTTFEGSTFHAGTVVIAAGTSTPYLLPELKPYMKVTGHPVFWLKPKDLKPFIPDNLPVYMADIAKSGWYGFPASLKDGVVKVAKHSAGLELNPFTDDRYVDEDDVRGMRQFLSEIFPSLVNAPLVFTRRCLYTDTLDGHFWIDRHPEVEGLVISTGGSGHGMKMGPVVGEMTADLVEQKNHKYSNRYAWRELSPETLFEEEARHKPSQDSASIVL